MERVLHRISAIRNRDGHIVGLTCRVGRALGGCASKIRDLVQRGESLLLLGRPGVGKTTAIRDIARVLADEAGKRVVIIDSANEIGGDGDVPHLGIGRARRLQIGASESQHRKMIEAVENHMPEVVVIDEIGTEEEAAAAQTIAQRGVQLIGTAHGNSLECLTKNPTLVDLVGGIESVTLGDEEARRRSSLKTVLERRAPPVFSVCVEMAAPSCWVVHPDVASAVDLLLQGVTPQVEVRSESPTGGVSVASRLWHPSMTPPRAAPFASLFQPSVISAPSVGTEVWEGDLMSSSSRVWTLQRSSVEGGNQGDEIEELLDEGEGEKDGSVETGREEEEEVERKEVVSGPASSLFEVPSPSLLETGDLAENATEIRGEGSPDSQEREIVSVSSGVTSSSAEDGAPEDGVVEIEVESERRELDKGNRTSSAVLAFERLREIVRDDDARRKLEREFLRRHLLTAKKSNPSASVLVETGREEKRRRKEEERERIRQEQRREAEEEEAAKEREAAETRKRRAALRKERRENRAVTKKEKKKQSPKSRRLSKLKEVLQNTEMREEDPGEIFENAVSKDQSAASTAELVAVYGHGDGKEGGKVEEDADSEDDVEEQQREREREYEKRMAALIAWNPEEEVTQIESESDRNTFSGLRIYSLSISDTRMRTVARAIGLDSSHLRVTHDIAAADAVIALKEEVHDGPAAAQLQELAASLGRPLPVFLVHHESPVQIAKTIRRLMARAKGLKGQVPGRNGGRGTRRKKGGSGRAGRSAAAASVS
uniref:AAA+ ATPase domain-containing protein n=1 Tax=Chromera velia CCMP2878 TaxID=1169474 RepID=A0A0G4HGS1_9ALVE|eukprot:Cvel_6793.t1-p1 / transcript=Cvel_6793.t1 / gene=Cvel_6793 / organism=Chromera_velia_CCMP2878 / gene_product=Uncharacterized protein ycf45, putative / transcript_product=Uncharacterized protein ycf45, putative / location=Cvel_scaffold341:78567-81157(-) / protein_length=770 / sequence_SO=supercontig / SO=protein_coding / is_pseudo=false